jgi:osmotically-inducible protein OsmY
MSTRYSDRDDDRSDDRDDDRYSRRYDYGGSYGETSRRYGSSEYGRDYSTRGGGRDYGRDYGASDYGQNYGRDYDRDYGRVYDRERDYGLGRGYGTPGYERDYSARYGRGSDYDYERGRYDYSEPSSRYSERYNYPSGYRSGEISGARYGRGYDYDRERYEREYGGRGGAERGWWDRTTDEVRSWFGDEEAERRRRIDEIREGRHRGRGPRGYRRSDDRIKEDINDRLTDDPYLDASDIEVSADNGEVILTGTVESRTAKRRAEDIVEAVSGVTNVQNNLRVSQWGVTRGTTTGTTPAAGSTGATGTTGAAAAGAGTTATGGTKARTT